jgi:CheY-like chemotaxis protein
MSKILVIEDNPTILELIVSVLRDRYIVIEASNGEDGSHTSLNSLPWQW